MKKYTTEELRPSMVHYNVHEIHYDKPPRVRFYELRRKYYLLRAKYYEIRGLHRKVKE